MKLISAEVGPFCSINIKQLIDIDPLVTVLVGMNESGKTVLLKCLHKSNSVNSEKYEIILDYPRKNLASYQKKHVNDPEVVAKLTYKLDKYELEEINNELNTELNDEFKFSVYFDYDNKRVFEISVDESAVIKKFSEIEGLNNASLSAIKDSTSLRDLVDKLADLDLNDKEKKFYEDLQDRIGATNWKNVVAYEVLNRLKLPKFLYFDDYYLLPGKTNLKNLKKLIDNNNSIDPSQMAVMALLRMAGVELDDFLKKGSYEEFRAKIENVSINLTDQLLEYWKQNDDLEVEIDIKEDSSDEPPFNDGPNLYLRIRSKRNRVTTSFDRRSKGFIWFFSFLVWFNDVKEQLENEDNVNNLILLLDEPGLSLHALAQNDLLAYIDILSEKHQVIYTTHSPFMVRSTKLSNVRVVEYKNNTTSVSSNLITADPKTTFPLQAALGWDIAQNLFINKNNLIVEGVTELTLLQCMSSFLESRNLVSLEKGITVVPVGGISNMATFISLLGANELNMVVLHDYVGHEDQRMNDLVKEKLINKRNIINVSQFRYLDKIGQNTVDSDIEDLFDESLYLDYFNKTFEKQLNGNSLKIDELEKGNRITNRIERTLKKKKIKVREGEGYNHYAVAAYFVNHLPENLDGDTLLRFEKLFDEINKRF